MPNDPLQQSLTLIEQFCKQNNILLFYGEVITGSAGEVAWDDTSADNLSRLLAIAKELGVRILHIQRQYNELEMDEDLINAVLSLFTDEQRETKQTYLEDMETLSKTKGQLAQLTLSFFYKGVCYSCENVADWQEVHERYSRILQSLGPDEADEKAEIQAAEETEKAIEEKARVVLQNKSYVAAKKPHDRFQIAVRLLLKEKTDNRAQAFAIARRSEELFQQEVQPQRDTAILEKLKALKAANAKLTKTAAAGKLKMTEREINKYWYLVEE